jgi:hypothetical protein
MADRSDWNRRGVYSSYYEIGTLPPVASSNGRTLSTLMYTPSRGGIGSL